MRKLAALLIFVLCVLTLSACGGKTVTTDKTAREMYDEIVAVVPINTPGEATDDMLRDLYYVDPAITEDYVAATSMTNISSDCLAIVKTTSDNVQTVADALEQRRSDLENSYAQYNAEQAEKAKNGVVKIMGNWVFLIILDDVDAAESKIDGFFE